jgi:hypothetical protein
MARRPRKSLCFWPIVGGCACLIRHLFTYLANKRDPQRVVRLERVSHKLQ